MIGSGVVASEHKSVTGLENSIAKIVLEIYWRIYFSVPPDLLGGANVEAYVGEKIIEVECDMGEDKIGSIYGVLEGLCVRFGFFFERKVIKHLNIKTRIGKVYGEEVLQFVTKGNRSS